MYCLCAGLQEAAALKKAQEDMAEEYNTWHKLSDKSEETGVMRVV